MYLPPGIPNPATIKDNQPYAVKGQTLRFILEMCAKVAGMRGSGVTNGPHGITINPRVQRERPNGQAQTPPVKFGKAVAGWTSGNTITLTPVVSSTDSTATGAANITANIFSPAGTPANVQISINQIVAYVTAPDGTHWLLNPNHGAFSGLGTLQYQVYQMTSTTVAGWDFVRASA